VRVLLHRFILCAAPGTIIDHKNGNGLDCTRENLRFVTSSQNQHNSGRRVYTGKRSSRFKGVHWHAETKKWVAQIMAARKYHYLGLFADEEDAARAYDAAATELHGNFARLNFPASPNRQSLRERDESSTGVRT
jgi:hypothetical protein